MKSNTLLSTLLLFFFLGAGFAREDMVVFDENYSIRGGEMDLIIDIDGGKVKVLRGEKRKDCLVHLTYNKEKTDADVTFDERRNKLVITLDQQDWFSLKDSDEKSDFAELIIELPTSPEIDLDACIKAGEIDFELGDLHLRNFSLRNIAGEVNIDFPEPNRCKLNSFDVNCKVGEINLLHLGNANFEEADINGGIGEMKLDFRGKKIDRAVVHIDLDIGETTVIIPDNIGVKMRVSKFAFLSSIEYPNWFRKKGKYYYSKNYRHEDKSLYLHVSTGIGEFRVEVE